MNHLRKIIVVGNADTSVHKIKCKPQLCWNVLLFTDGEIRILDSHSAKLMFSFTGFHNVDDFQVVGEDPSPNVDIVIWSGLAQSRLRVDKDLMRKCYEENKIEEFDAWQLVFLSTPSSTLSFRNSDMSFARSINADALKLFEFNATRGKPVNLPYVSFCDLFIPITDKCESILKIKGSKTVDLGVFWTVTIIAKKVSLEFHSGIIIEGVKENKHFVIRAHLTHQDDVTEIKLEPLRAKEHYEKIKKEYKAKQFQVSPDAA